MAPPTARFQIAFAQPALDDDPTWTDMDDQLRVAEYTIDRGRTFELDRVRHRPGHGHPPDTEGLLDPTNPTDDLGIQPLLQARLALWNPVLEDWYTRFRGFIEAVESDFDPSQLVNRVTISLVDIFELVSVIEMHPGHFGTTPPDGLEGECLLRRDPRRRRARDADPRQRDPRRRQHPGRVQSRLLRQRLPEGDRLLARRVGDGRDPGRG